MFRNDTGSGSVEVTAWLLPSVLFQGGYRQNSSTAAKMEMRHKLYLVPATRECTSHRRAFYSKKLVPSLTRITDKVSWRPGPPIPGGLVVGRLLRTLPHGTEGQRELTHGRQWGLLLMGTLTRARAILEPRQALD